MRHQVKGRKLGRSTPHRKATLQALSCALIKEHRIKTTLAKAKELRTFIEPIITTAKIDNTHNRRKVFSALQDKHAVTEIFEQVGPAAADRPGGYTRVLKLGFRLGDAAEMAVIELVDFNDVQPEKREAKKKRTRRAGKSNKPDSSADDVKKEAQPKTKGDKAHKKEKEAKKENDESSNQTDSLNEEDKTIKESKDKTESSDETVSAEEKQKKPNSTETDATQNDEQK